MKKKILLVDNDDVYIFLVKMLLEQLDMIGEIITAGNGSEALEMLKKDYEVGKLPYVIISDVEMPDLCGITFCKELSRLKLLNSTNTKLVFNSSNARYATFDWSVGSSTALFYSKPLMEDQLLTLLNDSL